jgi:hypothetical protein
MKKIATGNVLVNNLHPCIKKSSCAHYQFQIPRQVMCSVNLSFAPYKKPGGSKIANPALNVDSGLNYSLMVI